MSKPREKWWSQAKAMIRQYPNMTASKGVYKRLTKDQQREVLAVKTAILITRSLHNAELRMGIIKQVYFQVYAHSPCTLDRAAAKLHISQSTAYRYHRDFVRLVGQCYGLTK